MMTSFQNHYRIAAVGNLLTHDFMSRCPRLYEAHLALDGQGAVEKPAQLHESVLAGDKQGSISYPCPRM